MKTIICDIDGTITNMWPIEKSVLLHMTDKKSAYAVSYNKTFARLLKNGGLPIPEKYPLASWIIRNKSKYRFVYATGGRRLETRYVLKRLGLIKYFDLANSIDKDSCRFSKKTGIPFRKIKSKFKDCVLVSDSKADCEGAVLAGIPFVRVKPKQGRFNFNF